MGVTMSDVEVYLRHIGNSEPMRAIARSLRVQPSTILRRIRRVEDLRSDDPEFDTALETDRVWSYFRRKEIMSHNSLAVKIIRDTTGTPKHRLYLNESHIATLREAHMDIAMSLTVEDPRIWEIIRPLGPTMGEVIIRVCRTEEGIETIEKKVGLPARSGKVILRCALESLKRTTYADS